MVWFVRVTIPLTATCLKKNPSLILQPTRLGREGDGDNRDNGGYIGEGGPLTITEVHGWLSS